MLIRLTERLLRISEFLNKRFWKFNNGSQPKISESDTPKSYYLNFWICLQNDHYNNFLIRFIENCKIFSWKRLNSINICLWYFKFIFDRWNGICQKKNLPLFFDLPLVSGLRNIWIISLIVIFLLPSHILENFRLTRPIQVAKKLAWEQIAQVLFSQNSDSFIHHFS